MNFHTIPGPGSYGRHSNIDTCIVCTCTYRAESLKRRRMTLGLVQCRLLWVRCKNQPTTAHTICNHMHRARTDIHLFFHAFRWIDISFYCKNTPTPSYQSSSQINMECYEVFGNFKYICKESWISVSLITAVMCTIHSSVSRSWWRRRLIGLIHLWRWKLGQLFCKFQCNFLQWND